MHTDAINFFIRIDCALMRDDMRKKIFTRTRTRMYTQTHTHAHTHTQARTHVHMHTHQQIPRIHTHTRTHTHTHIHACARAIIGPSFVHIPCIRVCVTVSNWPTTHTIVLDTLVVIVSIQYSVDANPSSLFANNNNNRLLLCDAK